MGLLILLALITIAAIFNLSLGWVVVFYVIGRLSTLVLASVQFRQLFGSIKLTLSTESFKTHVFATFMLFAVTGFSYAHFSIDSIALGYLRPYSDVATFGAAAHLLEASQFAIRPLTIVMFPVCALLCTERKWGEMIRTLKLMFTGALVVGILAFATINILADFIIEIVYSSRFEESAYILRILYTSVPGLFVTTVALFVAASLNRERHTCLVLISGLALKIVLLPVVAPHYGPIGVAWLNFFTQSIIAVWLAFDAYRMILLGRR